jgi:hypothetical protein
MFSQRMFSGASRKDDIEPQSKVRGWKLDIA